MTKLDLKKADKAYYTTARDWHRVTLPPCSYLAVIGYGAPEGPDYAAALERLYPVAYGVKFAAKAEGQDFVVPPQSTQWWADDPAAFVAGRREEWRWRAMIRMPEFVTAEMGTEAARTKGVEGIDFIEIEEGEAFQMLHIGAYADEAPHLAHLHDHLMPEAGVTFGLPHHEIYLSDPRRTAPERLKTILRQPVRPA